MKKKPSTSEDTLCGRPVERVLEEITDFHGFPAPGVVIGAVIVRPARDCCKGCLRGGYFTLNGA